MLPVIVALLLAAVLDVARRAQLRVASDGRRAAASGPACEKRFLPGLPARFRFYAAAALLYGIVETLNGNWAVLYLIRQRGVMFLGASFALTAFWMMVTVGRLLVALLSTRLPSRWTYPGAAALTVLTLLLVSRARAAAAAVAAFGAAGLSGVAVLPLTISLGGTEFSRAKSVVSGELIVFYQIGYGLAAFGVGSLQDATGVSLSTVYALASIVAVGMAVFAFFIVRPRVGVVSTSEASQATQHTEGAQLAKERAPDFRLLFVSVAKGGSYRLLRSREIADFLARNLRVQKGEPFGTPSARDEPRAEGLYLVL